MLLTFKATTVLSNPIMKTIYAFRWGVSRNERVGSKFGFRLNRNLITNRPLSFIMRFHSLKQLFWRDFDRHLLSNLFFCSLKDLTNKEGQSNLCLTSHQQPRNRIFSNSMFTKNLNLFDEVSPCWPWKQPKHRILLQSLKCCRFLFVLQHAGLVLFCVDPMWLEN